MKLDEAYDDEFDDEDEDEEGEDDEKEVDPEDAKKMAAAFPAAWQAATKVRQDFENKRGKLYIDVSPDDIFWQEDELIIMSSPEKESENPDNDDIAIDVEWEDGKLKILSWREMS